MRHINPYKHVQRCGGGPMLNKPFCRDYTFTNPTIGRRYIQILKFVYDNEGCSRADILVGIGLAKNIETVKTFGRGELCSTFSQMLYADILDYKKDGHHCKYYVPQKGLDLLKQVNLI